MGGDNREKWIFILCIIVYFQYFFVRINSAEKCWSQSSFPSCCICNLQAENDSHANTTTPVLLCNDTCPEGYYSSSYDTEQANCTNTSVEITPESSNISMTTTSPRLGRIMVCLKCQNICLSCQGSDKNCSQCRFRFNNSCVEKCPDNFEGNEDRNCSQVANHTETTVTQVSKTVSSDPKIDIPVIIGASVGGGVALIAVIIFIIVCCVCRRNRTDTSRNNRSGRTAMSGILQHRQDGGEKHGDDATEPHSQHPIYENVERQNQLGNQIQMQGDIVLRYARDPTTMDKKKEQGEPDPTRASSYYENSSTIRRQQNIQDNNGGSGEQDELEQLGPAPLPPTAGKVKSQKSLKGRLSKKIKQLKGKAPPQTPPKSYKTLESQESHYLPMGPTSSQLDLPETMQEVYYNEQSNTASQDDLGFHQEVYEVMEDQPPLFEQENYANVENKLADVPSGIAPSPPPVEQEDYENIKDKFTVPKRAQTSQNSKGRLPDPPSAGTSQNIKGSLPDQPGAETSHPSAGSGDDKERKGSDYMNLTEYRRPGPARSRKDENQEELEDYENTKHLSKKQ